MALILEAGIRGFSSKRLTVNGRAPAAWGRSPRTKSQKLFMGREFFWLVTHRESSSLHKAFLYLNTSKIQNDASPGCCNAVPRSWNQIGKFHVSAECKVLSIQGLCWLRQSLGAGAVLFLSPFCRWANWGSEKLRDLPEITKCCKHWSSNPNPVCLRDSPCF